MNTSQHVRRQALLTKYLPFHFSSVFRRALRLPNKTVFKYLSNSFSWTKSAAADEMAFNIEKYYFEGLSRDVIIAQLKRSL